MDSWSTVSNQANGFAANRPCPPAPIWSSTVIPKPTTKSRWRLCKYARIYRILLWKNWLIRRRSPVLLIAELLFPLLFVLILVAFRLETPVYKEPECHVQSLSMPSMGLLHYLQSMVCNFNYTCHSQDPVPLTLLPPGTPLFYLVRNLTSLIADHDVREMITNFRDGLSFEHIPILLQAQTTLSSLWTSYETMAREFALPLSQDPVQRYMDTAREVSRLLCGQQSARENDLGRLITLIESFEAFNVSEFLEHMELSEPSATEAEANQTDLIYPGRFRAHQVNLCGFVQYLLTLNPVVNAAGRLRQFLFGQVAYYPQTPLTERVIELASERHQILVKLHQFCKLYFNSTRPWIDQLFRDPSNLHAFRDQLQLCAEDTFFLPTQVVHACHSALAWSSPTPNLTQPHWSRTIDSLDFLVGLIESMLDCSVIQDKFVPFTDKSEFDAYLELNQLDVLRSPIGLIFERLPLEWDNQSHSVRPLSDNQSDFISIVLRKSPFLIDTTYRYKVLDYYWTPAPRRNPNTDMKYFTSGFIDLQEDVSRAFLKLISSSASSSNAPSQMMITRPGTEFKMFPTAPFVEDGFMDFFAPNLPQLMVLAWSLTVVSAVKYMVDEKEHGLTEMLALLGVPSVLVQASWFTVSIILILGSCVPILAILKLSGIVANSNPFLLFCFTMSYAIAILSFAVLCSCFFRRANLAAVASGCVYFIFYLPAPLLLRYENLLSPDVLLGTSLLPQVSHSFGWAYFIRLEIHGPGAQWDNLWQGDSTDGPYSLGLAFVFLWSSVVIHLSLAVFVIPWVRLGYRWASPVISRFLFGPRSQSTYTGWMDALRENRLAAFLRERRLASSVSPDSGFTNSSPLSTPPGSPSVPRSNNQPTVVIHRLNKTYRYPHFVALDDVSLNMYPNEITVILGHNGAGKTTLMSILTGTTQQTSGTVLINGFDIRTQMDEVREQMGYCPQRDILYADLTVAEHIRFYSALKGLQDHVLRAKVDAYLDEFNFQPKRNALTKTLSGGQRRKLSVCLAFVGDASVVLLDEPTAGVDPLSKRVIWDTIRGMHPGRTVIFTSHHMREAEFLSDHIAILSRGRVCCASSSVSLKAKYGVGYVITVDKGVNAPSVQPTTWSDLASVIRKFIPQATVILDTVHYLKMRIPLEAALAGDDLVQLFRHLESQSYGASVSVTDTSLEDIFIEIMTLTVPNWADTSGSTVALLNLGKDVNLCSSNGKSNGGLSPSSLTTPITQSPAPNGSLSPTLPGLLNHDCDTSQSTATTQPESENSSCVLTPGKSLVSQQTAVVCAKRYHHLQRNKMLWVLEFLLPCLMVLLSLVLLTLYRPKIDQPVMDLHPWLMTAKRKIPLISFTANDLCDSGLDRASSPEIGSLLQSLVRENPYTWTGARCLSRDLYCPRPDDLIRCTPGKVSNKQSRIYVNRSHSDTCYTVNSSLSPSVPYYVLPTDDFLLNLTHFNIPDYLLHGKLDVSGEMYGGLTVNTIHARSNASTKAVVELITALRDWLSLLLWGADTQNTTNPDLARLFDMNLTTVIRLLLPADDHFRVWFNNKGYAAAPAYLNLLHNLQLYASSNASSRETPSLAMVVANHPLPFPKHTWSFTFRETLKIDAAFALFLLLALSFIPANFVVLLVAERELGIKHLHYVSGLRPHLYWFVNYAWDLLTYTVMALICVVFLALFQKAAFTSPTTILPFILIVFLHGCAIIPMIYLTTFVFRQPSTAFVLICAINMLIATVTTSISFFLELLTLQEPSLQTLTSRVQFVLRIFPHYCLGSGIYDLSVTRFLTEQGLLPEQTSAATWGLLYPRMLCLVAHTLCFLTVLALLESRSRLQWCWPRPGRSKITPLMAHCNEAVEEALCLTPGKTPLDRPSSAIQIRRLSKRYRRQSRPAVDNLNLTVYGGECFGLLGTNGAGKSTTFAMLSGQLAVQPGTVIVNGYDLSSQLSQAHQFMGFCPQSDALHEFLTAKETLMMYGRLRQLSGSKLHSVVRLLLRATGLETYANRLVRTYSGGTKRKLSAAIAFIGDPKVILLDEPSSGMDPSARKLLWRLVQSAVHRGCAVVLSSHCMEECETLCNRVGLLVDGQIRCDGGPLELKVRYSVGYVVDLELTHSAIQMDREELESRLATLLPGISLRCPLTTRQQYSYSPTDKLSCLFAALQSLRAQQLIKHFSVKHSTLEDAFVRCINQTENTPLM